MYAQDDCVNSIYKYNGPRNSNELSHLLMTSNSDVLRYLDCDTKTSLINNIMFDENTGIPWLMNNVDEKLNHLYQTNAKEVFSAIFGTSVIICTYDTKPQGECISSDEFLEHFNSDPEAWAFITGLSLCTNCYKGGCEECCKVGGNGCWDNFTMVMQSGKIYHVYAPN